jgi:hypothetical protein
MRLEADMLKTLLRSVIAARPDEIGCDRCLQELDRFVEMELAGRDASAAMPLVQHHLSQCKDCREEFEVLYSIVQKLG